MSPPHQRPPQQSPSQSNRDLPNIHLLHIPEIHQRTAKPQLPQALPQATIIKHVVKYHGIPRSIQSTEIPNSLPTFGKHYAQRSILNTV